MKQSAQEPSQNDRDERVKVSAPFKDTLRALLKTPPSANGKQPVKRAASTKKT